MARALTISSMPQALHEKGRNQEDCLSPGDIQLIDYDVVDLEAERRLLRKLDFVLLPLCGLLYLTNFIDRTVIGSSARKNLSRN